MTAGFLLAGVTAAVADDGRTPDSASSTGAGASAEPGGLGLSLGALLGRALGATDLLAPARLGRLRVPGDVRVLAVSSGADRATFGDGYAKQLTLSGDVDGVGLGTYTASVLFQVAPKAHVTAVDVYRKGRVDRAAVGDALQWARDHAKDLDAVVLAFPPASLLDPMAAGLAGGETRTVGTDAAASASASERTAAALAGGWVKLRDNVAELGRAGIAVVAPAGDLGPAPQSVLGVAGLPEVVTVGAADRDGVARASAGGPSVFGRVKPDLVAPAGIAGLVPDESSLAGLLDLGGPAAGPAPVLDLPVPAAGGRAALVGSTIPAAAAVTAIAAQLHHDGVADAATERALLSAAAVPLPGVPVWRQGAGRLTEAPGADLARHRPLVAGAADLGTEPAAGHPWAADLDILGGTAGPASFDLTERITTAASGKREALTAAAGEPRPVPAVSAAVRPAPRPAAAAPAEKPGPAAATDGLHLTLPPGDNPWAPGAWCGYLHLPLTGLGASVVEDVPLCLVEGLSLTAFNFFIHDMPAEDLTFALLPALPPGLGLLDGPLMVLPLDPLHEPLLAGVSGPDGLVHFPNVPPAYFVMRQFSDYGAPVAEDLPPAAGGEAQHKARDLGEVSYLNFDALVLPNPCPDRIQDHWRTGTPCHQAWLEQRFGSGAVRYERTTARYLVTTPAGEMGIVFDFTKKSPGTAVTSRYVDLLAHDDLKHGSAVSLEGVQPTLDRLGLRLSPAWSFQAAGAVGDPEGTLATYKGLDATHQPASLVGASTYPFALTTPNYRGTMALNFGYTIDDALVAVVVTVGKETRVAVLSPQGAIEVPKADLRPVLTQVPPFGVGTGQASFTFDLQPHGNAAGTLSFFVLPLNPLRPASVHLSDRSFELTTWQRIDWPPAMLPRNGTDVMGHSFEVDPHYSARQMNHPACRRIDNGQSAADVCEGWQVMVHSPLDDAETFDAVDVASGRSFLADLGGFSNPHRGIQGERKPLLDTGGLPLPVLTGALVSPELGVVVNGRFWEQLVFPSTALAHHPGPVEIRIEDNARGRASTLLPHRDGPVGLAPYIGFNPWHRRLDTDLLREVPLPGAPPAPLAWRGAV
ncbi:MAG TPA: S8 family serine peptidase [Acidimicrobiia bacterium]|nr:S8 family serine peptidase [Acidimicrobiia bacterium]